MQITPQKIKSQYFFALNAYRFWKLVEKISSRVSASNQRY